MGKNKPLEEQIVVGKAIQLYQDIELQFQGTGLDSLKEFDASKLAESVEIPVSEDEKTKAKLVNKDGKRKLIVTVEGIHTGMTKNLTFYPGGALEESVPSWTAPHNKPVIKNHDIRQEPLGRITGAEYVQSTLTDAYTVRLSLEITDQDAIEKILDGRYLTLSVGGSANRVNCSVCAKDLVQEGFCGHYRGKTYEGKQAHWIIGNYTGDEISFVNMPADVFSQVIATELASNEGGKQVTTEGVQEPEVTVPVTESEEDLIDNLLGESTENPTQITEEEDKPEQSEAPVQTQEESEDAVEPEGEPTPAEKTVEEKLADAEARILELEEQNTKADTDNVSLAATISEHEATIERLNGEVTEAKAHQESAEAEAKTFKEQSMKLAQYSRKVMAERVVDLRILHGKDEAEKRSELLETWSSSSIKVLQSTIADLLKNPPQRQMGSVTSPGLALEDKNSIDDNEEEEPKVKEKQKKTLADLEESMVSYMSSGFYNNQQI